MATFRTDVERIAARFGADPDRLAAIVRRAEVGTDPTSAALDYNWGVRPPWRTRRTASARNSGGYGG